MRGATWPDKYLFVVLFLLGAGAMVVLKLAGVRQAFVTAAPVAAMLLYAGYVVRAARFRLRGDQAGDSLYYLGFLFTMVSLAYSLYEFSDQGATQRIVTNFGIALTTTILGLMFRVVLHQLREDPFDVEREVRVDLSEAALELKGRILQATAEFDSLRVAISQSVREAAAAATAMSLEATTGAVERQQQVVGALTATVAAASGQIEAHNARMSAAGTRVLEAVEALAGRIDQVSIPAGTITRAAEELAGAIQGVTAEIGSSAERARLRLDGLDKGLEQGMAAARMMSDQVTLLNQAATAQRASVERATADLERIAAALNDLNTTLLTHARANVAMHHADLERLAEDAKANVALVQGARQRLEEELKTSTQSVAQVHSSLVSMTRLLVDKLDARHRRV